MNSERRIAANRRNAQQSRGPRTSAGKARVSRNALRHGLAVSALKDPAVSAEVDRLARALAGRNEEGVLLALARIIAEAKLDLERIQITKMSLMNPHLGSVGSSPPLPVAELAGACMQDHPPDGDPGAREVVAHSDSMGTAMINVLPQLVGLHRYERRARSRLMRAMGVFLAHKSISTAGR
jgi:hypothetical protein